MVNFKEIYHFSRFQRGSNIFQGGPIFSRGSNCLFPIETHITCDFPGGSGPPVPPLGPHLLSYTTWVLTPSYMYIYPTNILHWNSCDSILRWHLAYPTWTSNHTLTLIPSYIPTIILSYMRTYSGYCVPSFFPT